MAKAIGKPAGYVSDQAVKSLQKQFLVLFLTFYLSAFGIGILLGINRQPYSLVGVAIFLGGLPLPWRVANMFKEFGCSRPQVSMPNGEQQGELTV